MIHDKWSIHSRPLINTVRPPTAFNPKKNPLNVPIVQVSLFNNEDTDQHYRVGQALEGLRNEGILIIGAGMAVHNLHDFRATRGTGATTP